MKNLKTLVTLILVSGLIAANAVKAQNGFTGKIDMTFKSENKQGKEDVEGTAQITIKGDKMAFTASDPKKNAPAVKMILHSGERSMYVLNQEKNMNMAMKMDLDMIEQMGNKSPDKQEDTKVEVTGKKANINGYDCYEIVVTDESSKSEAWLTRDLDLDYGDINLFQQKKSAWSFGNDIDGFPIRTITYVDEGGSKVIVDLMPVEMQVSDEEVNIPKGAQIIDMGEMMKTMGDNPEMMEKMMKNMFGN